MGRRALTAGAAVAAVTAAALMLTACQAIPSTGPVQAGLSDLNVSEQQLLFNPQGPAEGASQEDILAGFLVAASDYRDDYAIARQFLAPGFHDEWDPAAGVYVYEGTRPFRADDDDAATLSLTIVAMVDEQGSMDAARPGPTVDLPYEFMKVGGQWRIAQAPDGIVLDRQTFLTTWSTKQLYFLSSDQRLIPDTRWFVSRSALTTQLVGELIAGPLPGMADSLSTAFPVGTSLRTNSVPVVAGTAHIDLTTEAMTVEPDVRELMLRQIAASLQSVQGVSRFDLSIGGAVIDSREVGWAERPVVAAENAYTLVEHEGVFGPLIDGKVENLAGIGHLVAQLDAEAVSVSPERDQAVVLTSTGSAWASGGAAEYFDMRPGQIAPSLDRFGFAWTYSLAAPETLLVTALGSESVALQLPSLSGRAPVQLRLSPSGTRLAMLVADGEQSAVIIAGVIRDEQGRPTAISDTTETMMWAAGDPLDIDWLDELRVAVLTQTGSAGKVTIGGLGIFQSDSGTVAGAIGLSGSGRGTLLRVLDNEQHLFAPQGTSAWQRVFDGVGLLAKSG